MLCEDHSSDYLTFITLIFQGETLYGILANLITRKLFLSLFWFVEQKVWEQLNAHILYIIQICDVGVIIILL